MAGCATDEGPAAPLPALEPVLAFANPAACDYGAALGQIFGGLATWDEATQRNRAGAPFQVPGLAQTIVPRLTPRSNGYLRVHAELRGGWHGLTVTGVETVFLPETDDIVSRILFAEPRERLIEVANQHGFGLDPRTGEMLPPAAGTEPQSSMFLFAERHGRGSALSCAAG